VKKHDARADFRRIVVFFNDQVRMVRDRDGDIGTPVGELLPKERWISQEERIRVRIDSLFDVIW